MADADVERAPGTSVGFVQGLRRMLGLQPRSWRDPQRCAAFTTAFVSLAAKMAAADGVAVAIEAATFERFLDVDAEELPNVRRLYAQAQQDKAGFEAFANRIAKMLAGDPGTKKRVFECLFYVACSDGILHPAEDKFLHKVGHLFGYDEHIFRAIRATFVHDPESPYAVLDIAPGVSDRAIKARHRKLVFENHPDRLMAAGAPAGVIKAATAKVAAYNAALEQIVAARRRAKS